MKFYPSLHKKNFGKDFFEGFPFPDNPPRQINGPALNIFIQELVVRMGEKEMTKSTSFYHHAALLCSGLPLTEDRWKGYDGMWFPRSLQEQIGL